MQTSSTAGGHRFFNRLSAEVMAEFEAIATKDEHASLHASIYCRRLTARQLKRDPRLEAAWGEGNNLEEAAGRGAEA